ncbi:hypothetical protein [Sphingomonas prati]|uniref:ElaB/YqjD/DUF883 family membrane-anchored ribosome-binding protein n=1 Tax=Sphingomonas prati TaxID=1843237 RepID=A0A7W9BSQ0_9SPHN|nr:hypothetical protein [Sphingomonas prati]MBB5729433.1 ElaB/YqjD/DUF883 family membrane-anchored ribosome-binding protein [Sphingomonas prati]GGE77446.1 hypothetical protein GCM10011404_07710 [Sphingomonas prati]
MAIGDTRLPEGTDSIIGGSSVGNDLSSTGGLSSTAPGFDNKPTPAPAATARETLDEAKATVTEKTSELRSQAADKARSYALMGKDRAVEGLDNVQRMIDDAADTLDEKLGGQFGDYVRQAGASVTTLSDAIRDKDVDELLDDTRDLVRRSPGIAIGAAAAIGFLVARVAKAGLDPEPTTPTTGGVTPVAPTTGSSLAGTRPSA